MAADGPTRVLLVDDHALVRAGLAALLGGVAHIDVVGEAADGRQAVDLATRLRPDVVLMDVSMPVVNGIDATRHIARDLPGTHVVMLTSFLSLGASSPDRLIISLSSSWRVFSSRKPLSGTTPAS